MAETAETIEWMLGGLSGLVVLGMIGFFVSEGLSGTDEAPLLSVHAEPAPADGEAGLRFRVENRGGQAATEVTVSLALADGARRSVVVEEVPAHSSATGGMFVPEGARADGAMFTIDGYVDP